MPDRFCLNQKSLGDNPAQHDRKTASRQRIVSVFCVLRTRKGAGELTRSFTRYALRALMSSLALGLVATGAGGAAAFAAGSASGAGAANAAPQSNASSQGAGNAAAANGSAQAANPGAAAASGTVPPASGETPTPPTTSGGQGSPAGDNSANGNKGHIQIEGAPDCATTVCGTDNDPHVSGCTLTVELFGYPSGTNAAGLTITGQAPSGTATVLTDTFTFTVPTTAPPNGSLLDTSRTYTPTASQLSALTPQPNQGYHLRVEVSVNGFHAKAHVVWLDCAPALSGATNGLTGSRGFLRPIGDAPAAAADSTGETPDGPLSVITARAPGDAPDSSGLAFTGLDAIAALAAAAALLLLGVGFVVLSRRGKRVDV